MLSLTIFTPTFNRANTISRTYESLKRQQSLDFEWLVIDDGSTDNTESLIKQWMEESPFSIRYIKQKNGGKYRAYNNGLRNAYGEMFFCVDSDDWLPDDAVKCILQIKREVEGNEKLAGCIALKEHKDKTLIGKAYPNDIKVSGLQNLERLGLNGERSLVFKTAVAKRFLFPENTQEKFMTEAVIYDRYKNYDFLIKNKVLTTCEYQEEGLSSTPRKLMVKNPAGYKLYFAQRIDMAGSSLQRVKYAISYNAFRHIYKGNEFEYNGCHKILVKALSPFGIILGMLYKRNRR